MKTSQIGVSLIKHFEGFISKPYLCPAGVATIGYGSTKYVDGKKVKLNDKAINENEATLLLKNTLAIYENIVNKKVKVQLKQSQFDALVSHTYNTGGSNTLFNLINNEANDESIRKWLETKYISANGKVLKGLVERRKAESKLYFHEK